MWTTGPNDDDVAGTLPDILKFACYKNSQNGCRGLEIVIDVKHF